MSACDLNSKTCKPCEGGVEPLTTQQIEPLMQQVPQWQLNENGKEITRAYSFKNYYQTMAFVNAIAWMAHQEDHHPDLTVTYNSCHVLYTTHAIDGLSENDFICAVKVDQLVANA